MRYEKCKRTLTRRASEIGGFFIFLRATLLNYFVYNRFGRPKHIGLKALSKVLAMSLAWEETELPSDCHHRRLTTFSAELSFGTSRQLPIARERTCIEEKLAVHEVVVVKATTGSGKSMLIPEFLYMCVNKRRPKWIRIWPVLVVQQSIFAAEKLRDDLVEEFGWNYRQIHVRTGKHVEKFVEGLHQLSIITYGILWQWLTQHDMMGNQAWNSPIRRYSGFFLDEFADLSDKKVEACRLLVQMLRLGKLVWDARIVAAAYAVDSEYAQAILGEHCFIEVSGRYHTMERCVVAPKDGKDILEMAGQLALAALARTDERQGDAMIFLPGMQEILTVQSYLKQRMPELRVWKLHSDVIDDTDEAMPEMLDVAGNRKVVLSTVIGARTVTLEDIRYVFVHPAIREEVLHASGIKKLVDVPVTKELEGNKCGRTARTNSGLATLLYETDDSEGGLKALRMMRPSAKKQRIGPVTLVCGSPSRLYLVEHTCRHLRDRGFDNVYWLRTPGPDELESLSKDPKARVMMFWYSTVLPALKMLNSEWGVEEAFVLEDTCLLASGVTFADVYKETKPWPASIFGYGKYEEHVKVGDEARMKGHRKNQAALTSVELQLPPILASGTTAVDFEAEGLERLLHWHGTKGIWATVPWW